MHCLAALLAAALGVVTSRAPCADAVAKPTVSLSRLAIAKAVLRAEAPTPAAKGEPAKVHILDAAPEQLEVGSASGVRLLPEKTGVAIEANQPTLLVQPGAQLTVRKLRAAPAAPVPLSTDKQSLPGSVLVGTVDAQNRTVARQLQPFVAAERLPLRWEAAESGYTTTVLVGLDAQAEDVDASLELHDPIVFQITGRNVDRIQPPQVTVASSGPTGYREVTLLTRSIAPPVEISAHSAVGDVTFTADIDPGPAYIEIGAANASIDGLGLGRTSISVTQRASNGALLAASAPLIVNLSTSAGQLAPARAEIPKQASSVEVRLTSSGVTEAVVSELGGANAGARAARVRFVFPWLKLLLGLAGAAAAGFLRALMAKDGRATLLLASLATGIVVDILLALGAPIAPSWALDVIQSELAWLALGFVGGFPGSTLLSKLAERVFTPAS